MKAKDVRRGTVILYNSAPYKVLDFFHNTPGKGNAVVQTKLRNLMTGIQTEVRFASTADVEEADVYFCKGKYLYNDAEGFHFMNPESFEQYVISKELLADALNYLQDEMEVDITLFNNDPIGISLPSTVVLTVIDTEPELRGATQTNSAKPAKTNTGLTVSVPPFIKIGDQIIVNTEEGSYISRA